MEFIASYNWSITVVLILAVISLLIGGAYFIVWYGKLQAKLAGEYMKKYLRIQKIIRDYEVCEMNYEWIEKLFDHLLECKYKNREMTETLTMEFFRKYEKIAKERVNEND